MEVKLRPFDCGFLLNLKIVNCQLIFTSSKSTIETLEKGMNYVQSQQ